MKNLYLAISAVLMAAMLLLPLIATVPVIASPQPDIIRPVKVTDEIRLKISQTGEITKIKLTEYLYGAVAAEMPASYSEEALKAQAVAAYTYFLFRKAENSKNDYDISDSPALDQAYLSDGQLKEKWGAEYDAYAAKIKKAIADVSGLAITYDGKPILAAYHAISSGKTESAADVWGGEYPYLTQVESIGDLLCPDYLSSVSVSAADFSAALKDKVALEGDASGWIGAVTNTASSAVKEITVGGTVLTGNDIRTALGLRSCSFDVACSDGSFTFTVRGYGHGVGMSQYGANYMALQGSTYIEILSWYYPGCKLEAVT